MGSASAIAFAIAGHAHGDPAKPATPAPPAQHAPANNNNHQASKTAARAPAPSVKRPTTPALPVPVAASRNWHSAQGKTPQLDPSGRPMLVLQSINTTDRVALTAHTEHGGFSAPDLDRASFVLREWSTGNQHPIDPRVLDLVYRVAVHFNAPELRIISGYRTPRNGSHSNHGRGRAIDLVVPGTSDEEVAKFAREQGFVGVGVYPTSGFVHLDVRERSYFWVDSSGPGKKNRARGILADLATKSDAKALARGEHAIAPFGLLPDVDAVLARAGSNTQQLPAIEDDDNDEAAL